MYTENGVTVDLAEIHEIIEKADVFAVAFRLFPERLLIDTRFDASDPDGPSGLPMVAIVDPVETLEERFFWLGQHRPALGSPQQFMFFFWPHSIRYLEESGVWDALKRRIVLSRFAGAASTCDDALRDLAARERQANAEAVTGARYQTIWQAST
jgi:hypothetical protein